VDRVELITPVPGGVGPVTVMMLARNLVLSWAKAYNIPYLLDRGNEKEYERI